MKEVWKNIIGFEDKYQVSNLGRIKSLFRIKERRGYGKIPIPEKILSPHIDKVGYPRVTLYGDHSNFREVVHRIVAKHFIANDDNRNIINHKNGIKTDNRAENLEWCTQKENINHSFRTKLQIPYKGEECSFSKLKESDVIKIKKMLIDGNYTQSEIGSIFGVTRGAIKGIHLGHNWKHLN